MNQEESKGQKPISERLEAVRNLPKDILKTLTKLEVKAFLYDDVWPESLREKLKDYVVDEEE
ncbi:MAG: hypothetical protein JW896_04485 [Deltaproteobacteria bacterium]|nr:hypothetical protein [Deltaproteobacteria bacterium]